LTVELVKPTEFCHSIRSDFFEISFKSFFRFAKHIFISRLDITNPGSSSRTPSVKFYKIIYRACVPLHVLSGFGVNLSRRSAESPANGLEYEDYDRISLGKHSLGKHSSRNSPFHPYQKAETFWRYLSVALSLESPPLGVTQHPRPTELGLSSSAKGIRDYPAYSPYFFTRNAAALINSHPRNLRWVPCRHFLPSPVKRA